MHQVRIGHRRNLLGNLVQRKRKNKGERLFVHQVSIGRLRNSIENLVQSKRKNKG